MKFQITEHAKERLKQRVGVSDRKMIALCEKAWNSTEPIIASKNKFTEYNSQTRDQLQHSEREHRTIMGFTFIFAKVSGRVRRLITVI